MHATDSAVSHPRRNRRWLAWIAGIALFVAPLLLWTQVKADESQVWQGTGSHLGAPAGVGHASDQGLTTLYRWSSSGLKRSVDDGRTWAPIGANLPTTRLGSPDIRSFAVGAGRTIYVLAGNAAQRSLYRSTDNGSTFDPIYQPLDFAPEQLAVAVKSGETSIALTQDDAIIVSLDGGVTWSQQRLPGEITTVAGAADLWAGGEGWLGLRQSDGIWSVHPLPADVIPRRIISSGRNPLVVYIIHDAGLIRSTDLGQTWQAIDIPTARPVTALAIDPLVEQTIYLGDAAGQVWRSDDGGTGWRQLASPGVGAILTLFQTQGGRDRLYAASGFDLWWLSQTPLEPTPTPTASPSATSTHTPTPTATATTTPSATPSPTASPTPTASSTATLTPTPTPRPRLRVSASTNTPTASVTATPAAIPTVSSSPSDKTPPTVAPAATSTPAATATPAPPTPIPTPTSYR